MTIANPHLQDLGTHDPTRQKLKNYAVCASLSVATLLITFKFFAWLMTDSVSILSSLMDSALDLFASLITMIGVIHAATPADSHHRFGHGKAEALSAMVQAVFVLGSAVFLLFEAARRIWQPVIVTQTTFGIGVCVLSIVLTCCLLLYQKWVLRRTSSVAIRADHLHYKGDIAANTGVLITLVLSRYSTVFDPLFALGTAVFLGHSAYAIARESVDILLDRELSTADRQKIETLVAAHPVVHAVHDLRTRSAGARIFIEFHMELDGSMTLEAAHRVTEEIEKTLYDAFPTAEVIIHQEPAGLEDYRLDRAVKDREDKKKAGSR